MTSIPPSSDEATLFVPMHLDALVVNKTIHESNITYNRWQMNYDRMRQFVNPMPGEFVSQQENPPPEGVHLHWTLPSGLTHGVENKNGQIDFPFVPNRWLVVRLQSSPIHNHPDSIPAWVLISDALGKDKDYTSPYLDPYKYQRGIYEPTWIGKKVAFADWHPQADKEGEPFLKAIAPGNITFAAFAPGVENVFAFHDDLKEMEATTLAYLVVGWYSQLEMDPLQHLPEDDWKCKFLFNVGPHFQADLDEGSVSEQLSQVSLVHKAEIPKGTPVEKGRKGNEWLIKVEDKTYTARLENGEVFIYDSEVTIAAGLNWAVKLDGTAPPRRTLVHGMVYDVDWKPEGELSKPINVPSVETISQEVRIAVGNTSADALAALIDSLAKNAGLEGQIQTEFLEAFQYNLLSTLDQVGSKTLLDQQIRQNWFGSDPGGIRWTVVAKEQAGDRADQKPPKISPDQEAGLAKLNEAQRELDAERRILISMQRELYTLWWKSRRIEHVDPRHYRQVEPSRGATPPPKAMQVNNETPPSAESGDEAKPDYFLRQIIQSILQFLISLFGKKSQDREPSGGRDEIENDLTPLPQKLSRQLDHQDSGSFLTQVITQQDKVKQKTEAVPIPTGPESESSIATYAKDQLDLNLEKLELKPVPMPRFWHPTDPVIVISGLGRPPKQGLEGTLLCRLASQVFDGVNFLPDDYQRLISRLSGNEYLPTGVTRLLRESFFLDPGNVEIIARDGLTSLGTKEAVEKAIQEIQPDPPPEGISVEGKCGANPWEQPWSPLFLDWKVSYFYTCEHQGDIFKIDTEGNYIFDRKSWFFNGIDTTWIGSELNPQERKSYSGRTFLTPHAPLNFLDRLQKYLQSQPDDGLKANKTFFEKIANWDILSQTLSGFSDELALRSLEYTVPPDGSISKYIEGHHHGVPFMTYVPDPGEGIPYFFPIRAGFLKFEAIRILDKFGRTLDLLDDKNENTKEIFRPIRGRGMIPSRVSDHRLVELPPRLVQSSRLFFRFVSAADDRLETGLAADANPVCGWLLPNYIDKSISVYQADGSLLGWLMLLEKSEGVTKAHWRSAPSSGEEISNQHLWNMIEALTGGDDKGAAFINLLQAIDKRLWTIDLLGQRNDQNLSVLIGRPLALVRANLQLELYGKPYFNQAWYETFRTSSSVLKENSGGLLDLEFPIRLGCQELRNEGLIGYFQGKSDQETDYTHFHTGHDSNQVDANNDYVMLKFKATTPVPFDPTDSVYLTMLIDPQGVIHVNSGLLPTKVVELPKQYISKALDRMAIMVRAGPLLLKLETQPPESGQKPIDPGPDPREISTVRLPLAAVRHGTWIWIQATDTQEGKWTEATIVKADANARFSTEPLNLVEGWLKFSPDEIDEKKEGRDEKKNS